MKGKFWSAFGLAICLMACLMVVWPNQPAQGVTAMGLQEDFIRVVERVKPSVVSLKAVRVVTYQVPGVPEDFFRGTPFEGVFRDFGPSPAIRKRQVGQGSGIIIDSYGHILTNTHVVAGAQQIKVHLDDGREVMGKVVGSNERLDIALIYAPAQNLRPAMLGDSARIRVGQWAIAIGSPFGLEQTVTVGVVSATGRRGVGKGTYGDFIQTDASINPGNSGGPLCDLDGRVMGINSMIVSTGQGIGFAIPINLAKRTITPWLSGRYEGGAVGNRHVMGEEAYSCSLSQRGSRTMTVAPGGLASIRTSPWCSVMMRCTVVRPMPVPWGLVEQKGSKT
jgi:S1-C subfamily serine protease